MLTAVLSALGLLTLYFAIIFIKDYMLASKEGRLEKPSFFALKQISISSMYIKKVSSNPVSFLKMSDLTIKQAPLTQSTLWILSGLDLKKPNRSKPNSIIKRLKRL